MPTSVDIKNLKINKLTEAQYDTAVQGGVIGENELSVLTDAELEQIQVSVLPTASADELGNIYQFVGTTDANYTNGYFYKCVSDGQNPATYSWEAIEVQASSGGLPSQTGQSGKFLTTDGTDASWGTINALQNTATGAYSLSILGTASTFSYSVNIGIDSIVRGNHSLAVGRRAKASTSSAAIGDNSNSEFATKSTAVGCSSSISSNISCGVAIGYNTYSDANYAIQLGTDGTRESGGYSTVNSDANTLKVANANGNFEFMSANGTIPKERLVNAINKYSTMPTAASTNEGWIVQYTGTTDSTYTHGYIYECVSDGAVTPTYSWSALSVQAGGGGSSYTAGTGIDITNGTISVTSPTLQNTATGANSIAILGSTSSAVQAVSIGQSATADVNGSLAVGYNSYSHNTNTVAVGYASKAQATYSIAMGSSATAKGNVGISIGMGAGTSSSSDANQICIGYYATATAKGAYQFGYGTNSEAGTVCFALNTNGSTSSADWHNYKLLNSDGTIPKERLTNVTTVPSTMPTLAAADWSSNTQTVTVTGVTASNIVFIAPAPASATDYAAAGIICTAQSTNSLTFTCTTTPSNDITVNVVIM